jgi:hypothetical protein
MAVLVGCHRRATTLPVVGPLAAAQEWNGVIALLIGGPRVPERPICGIIERFQETGGLTLTLRQGCNLAS